MFCYFSWNIYWIHWNVYWTKYILCSHPQVLFSVPLTIHAYNCFVILCTDINLSSFFANPNSQLITFHSPKHCFFINLVLLFRKNHQSQFTRGSTFLMSRTQTRLQLELQKSQLSLNGDLTLTKKFGKRWISQNNKQWYHCREWQSHIYVGFNIVW